MDKIIKQNGINFGLILGFLLILPVFLGYAINVKLIVSYWILLYVFLSIIIVGIVAIAYSKKYFKGIISFKDAFSTYFVMLVISLLISIVMNFLLFNVIDSDFKQVVKEEQIKTIESQREWIMVKLANAPQEQVDETDAKFDEAIQKINEEDQYSISSLIKGFFISIAIFSLFGLLLALILKSKKSDEEITSI